MRKRNTVSKEVSARGCKLPSRHGHITWFGKTPTSTGHRGSSDHRLALRHQGDAGKQRRVPPRHRVSSTATVSLGHPAEIHYGTSPPRRGVSSSPAQSVVATPHQVRWSHDGSQVFACRSKTSLKFVLSRTKPKQTLSTLTSVLKPI